jgi:hypothetical protein
MDDPRADEERAAPPQSHPESDGFEVVEQFEKVELIDPLT